MEQNNSENNCEIQIPELNAKVHKTASGNALAITLAKSFWEANNIKPGDLLCLKLIKIINKKK